MCRLHKVPHRTAIIPGVFEVERQLACYLLGCIMICSLDPFTDGLVQSSLFRLPDSFVDYVLVEGMYKTTPGGDCPIRPPRRARLMQELLVLRQTRASSLDFLDWFL